MAEKTSSPAYSIGTSKHQQLMANNHYGPGPGAYDSHSTLQISKQQNSKPTG